MEEGYKLNMKNYICTLIYMSVSPPFSCASCPQTSQAQAFFKKRLLFEKTLVTSDFEEGYRLNGEKL
jgi:hypothetical protein